MQAAFELIAKDVPGAEGPVFDRRGRFFVVAPRRGSIRQVLEGGVTREHCNTGGVPAGLQVDQDNWLWVADMELGILKVDPDGHFTPVVTTFEGRPIRGCNDLTFDSDGNLYFTAPAGSGPDKPVGELFCRLLDGHVLRIDEGFAFCNGIAVSPDGSQLIVAETCTKKLWAYDIEAPGRLAGKRHWGTVSGDHDGGPDGLDFDTAGHLLAANIGGSSIDVFAPDGELIEQIRTDFEKPSNLHFGGPDGCSLFITEHTNHAVWKTRWKHPGLLALSISPTP